MARKMWASLTVWAGWASGAGAAEQGFWDHQIETQMTIAASAERVWTLLMDFQRYPQWNPFIKHIEGRPEAGEKLRVRVQPTVGRAMSFEPQVLVAKTAEEFRWKGRFLVPGLLDGEHHFLLRKDGDHKTPLIHGERFSGLLVPFFRSQIDSGTRSGFEDQIIPSSMWHKVATLGVCSRWAWDRSVLCRVLLLGQDKGVAQAASDSATNEVSPTTRSNNNAIARDVGLAGGLIVSNRQTEEIFIYSRRQ